jgi:CheY-like chemotaxis protein
LVNVRIHPGARFNVLLTEDRLHAPGHWTEQLPRLLEPQGVASYLAHTGREAFAMAERLEFHAAVIDLGTPLGDDEESAPHHAASAPTGGLGDAGWWLLELFRRLPNRPPIVVVHSARYTDRQVSRLLTEALRRGAFSVLNTPVHLEELLRVFQRLVDRQYQGAWPPLPDSGGAGHPGAPAFPPN